MLIEQKPHAPHDNSRYLSLDFRCFRVRSSQGYGTAWVGASGPPASALNPFRTRASTRAWILVHAQEEI